MTAAKPSIWIVILNWNGLADTLTCLDSLSRADLSMVVAHTLVIDNASRCDPRPEIHHRFPWAETVRMDHNLGFAGGCNYGLARAANAHADYTLLLNNDTVVDPDFLAPLVTYAEEHPGAGLVGSLICNLDHPDRISSAGARVDLAFGLVRIHYFQQPRSRVPSQPYATEFVTGCCMLLPTRVLVKVGPFDEGLFAYYDDVDYCVRVRDAGLAIACVPRSVVWHRESSSTRRGLTEGVQSPLKHYLSVRNRIAVVRRHGRRGQRAFFFLVVLPGMALYYTLGFIVRGRWAKMRSFWQGVFDGVRRKVGAPIGASC
ncbi:MAG TPA: glycosyltransferase family 2 protein [Candidatus Methylomirabilis sp.]|nr:glycosyltransferase family 2 protein [Candidatus Methylomirabilis sp.]